MKTLCFPSAILWALMAGQDPKSAEEVVKSMKAALGKSPKMAVEFVNESREATEGMKPREVTYSGKYWFDAGNKMRCQIILPAGSTPKEQMVVEIVSDGARIGSRTSPGDPFTFHECPASFFKGLNEVLDSISFAELSVAVRLAARAKQNVIDSITGKLSKMEFSNFELCDPEQIEGRPFTVVRRTIKAKGKADQKATVRLWIDPSTWLPYKREETFESGNRISTRVEIYKTLKIGEETDPRRFELPKEVK
jgi:outer membrane lipoprotein-sorting protein